MDSPVVVDSPVVDSDVSVVWADADVVFAVHLHGAAVEVIAVDRVVEVFVYVLQVPASEELARFIKNITKVGL